MKSVNGFKISGILIAILAGIAVVLLGSCSDSSDNFVMPELGITKSNYLTGFQEVPPKITGATGFGTATVIPSTRMITGSITTTGITGTAAHIHEGPVGVASPVIVPMTETPPGSGVWVIPPNTILTESQFASFQSGNLYFNVHSAANPGGEIRGQIGLFVKNVTLTGAQETPPRTTAATGTGLLTYNPDLHTISGRVVTTGIAGIAAHIHTGPVGVAAPVSIPMAQSPADSNTWLIPDGLVLTDAQVADLFGGNMYFNVHSAAFPGGEIRGQIGRVVRYGLLTGAQEVPPNASSATGTGVAIIEPETRFIFAQTVTTGITGTAAHIHQAPGAVAGGIIVPQTQTAPGSGIWNSASGASLTPAQYDDFFKGNLYFNVHSAAIPGGEIRGQIVVQ
jgi:CHRD domain